jgi:hypothetical protein
VYSPHFSGSVGRLSANLVPTALSRQGWLDFVFAFHDRDEIGPRVLARIAKHTGLRPEDL